MVRLGALLVVVPVLLAALAPPAGASVAVGTDENPPTGCRILAQAGRAWAAIDCDGTAEPPGDEVLTGEPRERPPRNGNTGNGGNGSTGNGGNRGGGNRNGGGGGGRNGGDGPACSPACDPAYSDFCVPPLSVM